MLDFVLNFEKVLLFQLFEIVLTTLIFYLKRLVRLDNFLFEIKYLFLTSTVSISVYIFKHKHFSVGNFNLSCIIDQ